MDLASISNILGNNVFAVALMKLLFKVSRIPASSLALALTRAVHTTVNSTHAKIV